ncbi:ran GTPase activating protein 1, variant [Capsaspora owczarzaki ATCC 30864]|nr:ran GTPase activating protein 1, variant [Capsaspora owczarzaki ATCC 30864]KJE92171.1 ran GTPase activating protein 1, variant [Capsaspora owczarzaki ATCC 30864]|eukprot:XP_011270239.1 ran GTPase activating protein 1, variant [Capsaspora owczarzaki ATCC 30864]
MPKLREINFSDNAFGPIGAERLSPLIAGNRNLEVIRVNNNGLGSIGGTIVAKALCELANSDQPVRLHTFVAGRNRLENKGATALAHAFTQLKTLRLIAMPQNGIHYIGIGKLAEAFVSNPGLQVIDLNDNTFTSKGGKNMAKAIASLKTLKRINFGDCLARKAGGKALIEALTGGHELLEDLDLSYNELKPANAEQLIEALKTLTGLKQINVLGNEMSNKGVKKIKAALASGVQYTAPDEDDEDDQSCDDDDDDEEEEESEAEPEEEEQEEEEAAEESVPASAVKPSATAEVEVLTGQVAALNVSAP